MQTVLRETVCSRVSGGKLDFPRHASFAAIKIVTWWEAEFSAAFRHPSGLSTSSEGQGPTGGDEDNTIKKTPPSEFILLVIDTCEQLLGKRATRWKWRMRTSQYLFIIGTNGVLQWSLLSPYRTILSDGIMISSNTNNFFYVNFITAEHLHTLIQESLDHADLTVLTATLGAAALIRNCLWCYNQQSKDKIPQQSR